MRMEEERPEEKQRDGMTWTEQVELWEWVHDNDKEGFGEMRMEMKWDGKVKMGVIEFWSAEGTMREED